MEEGEGLVETCPTPGQDLHHSDSDHPFMKIVIRTGKKSTDDTKYSDQEMKH